MAKTTKKAFAGMTSKAPSLKKTATSNPKKLGAGLVSFGPSAKKKTTPKKTGFSNASKVKDFFKEKPKYTSEVIVWNKKMDAAEAARKKKK